MQNKLNKILENYITLSNGSTFSDNQSVVDFQRRHISHALTQALNLGISQSNKKIQKELDGFIEELTPEADEEGFEDKFEADEFEQGYMRGLEVALSLLTTNKIK